MAEKKNENDKINIAIRKYTKPPRLVQDVGFTDMRRTNEILATRTNEQERISNVFFFFFFCFFTFFLIEKHMHGIACSECTTSCFPAFGHQYRVTVPFCLQELVKTNDYHFIQSLRPFDSKNLLLFLSFVCTLLLGNRVRVFRFQ